MKLNEVSDPTMKLRFEVAKLRADMEERDERAKKTERELVSLQQAVAKLIRKLGPQ
jgi:adenylate kinase